MYKEAKYLTKEIDEMFSDYHINGVDQNELKTLRGKVNKKKDKVNHLINLIKNDRFDWSGFKVSMPLATILVIVISLKILNTNRERLLIGSGVMASVFFFTLYLTRKRLKKERENLGTSKEELKSYKIKMSIDEKREAIKMLEQAKLKLYIIKKNNRPMKLLGYKDYNGKVHYEFQKENYEKRFVNTAIKSLGIIRINDEVYLTEGVYFTNKGEMKSHGIRQLFVYHKAK